MSHDSILTGMAIKGMDIVQDMNIATHWDLPTLLRLMKLPNPVQELLALFLGFSTIQDNV